VGFPRRRFYAGAYGAEPEGQKTPVSPQDDVRFDVVGYYLYGAPANGNSLQGQLFLRPLRDAVSALPGFQFGDIAEENLSRSLDEVQLTLDEQGRGRFQRKASGKRCTRRCR
jgi:uncharacterized protein YfaS (alpha-2-macroglobulin family)